MLDRAHKGGERGHLRLRDEMWNGSVGHNETGRETEPSVGDGGRPWLEAELSGRTG